MRLGPDLSRRSNEPELLDGAHCPPDEVVKSLSDLRFVNRWFSARGRLLREVARHMPPGGRLLDVGCGSGDVAAYLQSRLSPARWKRGGPVRAVGVDLKPLHLRHAPRCLGRVAADVWRLPFRDASFDVVTASLFLHHFADGELARLLRELARSMERIQDRRDGAVCVFWTKHQLEAQHLGVCVPGGFIHCRSRVVGGEAYGGKVIFQKWTRYWIEHVHSFWWYRGHVIPGHKKWR